MTGQGSMDRSSVDFSDIQALVRYAHGPLTEACFFLLRIADRGAARAWLRVAQIANARAEPAPSTPDTALHIAFTAEGLRALGVSEAVIAGFSAEFLSGMAGEASRSRRLGDIGASAPGSWEWGRDGTTPHLAVMLYAKSGKLEVLKSSVTDQSWRAAFELVRCLSTTTVDGREPFGFRDGISQPQLDWARTRAANGDALERDYGNLVALGEFLLGYRNEYGKYTDRPLIDPGTDPNAAGLPAAEDAPELRDLGRNGTYLILRQLRQDVRGFWRFLDKQASSNRAERERLATSMVGRTLEGVPVMPLMTRSIAGIEPGSDDAKSNQFTFDAHPGGTRGPFGAHIQRANPRTADLPPGTKGFLSRLIKVFGFNRQTIRDDMIASARFHRILRRGRDYGPYLPPDDALRPGASDEDRGLHFICLVANISRQFEFVQNAWVMSTKFNGLSGESDPLLGNRQPIPGCPVTSSFSMPREGKPPDCLVGVPQFVTVRGGAYFFLPGVRALRYLATDKT